MVARNLASHPARFTNQQWEESVRIVLGGLAKPPTTSRGLYIFLMALTGEKVPYKKVCAHHSTPWDMIWESYRVDLPGQKGAKKIAICVGPRDGQKTLSMAKLNVAELLLKANCVQAFVAATDWQASRGSTYMKRYLAHPAAKPMIAKMVNREILATNGAKYEQLVGGINSSNSFHPHKLRTDEVELVRPRAVIEEMKMMPSSYGGISQHQIYCSTRKFVHGPMSKLFAEARPSSTAKIIWCYKEISEPCPDSRSGTKPQTYEVPDLQHPGETLVVEAFDGCGSCPLLPSCRGDLKKARGSFPIDDTIESYHKLSREAWLIQKECMEPSFTEMFFSDWDPERNVGDYPPNPKLPLDLSFDFTGGGEDPTSVGFWQTDGTNQYRVHEMIFRKKPTSLVAQSIELWLKDRGLRIRHAIGDSAQQQQITDLKAAAPSLRALRATRKILRKEGLMICKRFVKDTTGARHLFVNKSCTNFISEIENAIRKDNDGDDFNGDDHSLDDWRYWTVELFHHGNEPRMRWLDFSAHSESPKPSEEPKAPEAKPSKPDEDGLERQIRHFINDD